MKKLLLVDGHSLIHRAYHAYPRTLATKSGELTNAVYGFTNMLLTAVSELQPTHVAVAFDLPKPTFRETMFVGYKQSRVKPDDDLIAQIPRIKEVVGALNIPIFEVAGYEADDVIGTLCREATREKAKKAKMAEMATMVKKVKKAENSNHSNHSNHFVIILTSDRDLMQLIRGDIVVVKMPERGKKVNRLTGQQVKNQTKPSSLITFSREAGSGSAGQPANLSDIWNEARFIQEWGFAPTFLPDYKAFAGDASDDIPGVKGIGEKTAKELVKELGSIENIYKYLTSQPINRLTDKPINQKQKTDNRKPITESVAVKLTEGYDMAVTSKKLATIDTAVPIKLDWKQTEIHRYNKNKILEIFEELQFKSLVRKLPNDTFEQQVQEALF